MASRSTGRGSALRLTIQRDEAGGHCQPGAQVATAVGGVCIAVLDPRAGGQ